MIYVKSLNSFFPDYGTGCVAKVAYVNDDVKIDTLVEGYAQVKPNRILMKEDFLFDIASLTKTFTAILVHKAIERGFFSLSDSITDIDPRFIHLQQVTISDLLTHSTEIWTNGYLGDVKSKDEFYDLLFHSYVKGTQHKYIDVHYMILAVLLEKIYDLTYREIVVRDIIEPLHLKHTVFQVSKDDSLVSCNYQIVDGKEVTSIVNVPHDTKARIAYQLGFTTGHAGIFTTASDLLKILISLMDGKETLLKRETVISMFQHDDYASYLNDCIDAFIHSHGLTLEETEDIHFKLQNLLQKLEDPNDFLSQVVKPYNYVGMRYQNPFQEITTIPFQTSEHTVIFSGYTGPIYLMDFDQKIIVLVMTNVCHTSTKERSERLLSTIHMVQTLYEEAVSKK